MLITTCKKLKYMELWIFGLLDEWMKNIQTDQMYDGCLIS